MYGNNEGIEREQASEAVSRDSPARLEPEGGNIRKHHLLQPECVWYTVCEPEHKLDNTGLSKWRWQSVGPTYNYKPASDRIIIIINTGCRGLSASAGFFRESIYDGFPIVTAAYL